MSVQNEEDNSFSTSRIMNSLQKSGVKEFKSLVEKAEASHIVLEINNKNNTGWYPLLKAVDFDNLELVDEIINYANTHDIVLNINEKEDLFYLFPLLCASINDSLSMVKKLIDYANDNILILNIDEKNKYGYDPILIALLNSNFEIVDVLIDYCSKKEIPLNFDAYNKKEKYKEYKEYIKAQKATTTRRKSITYINYINKLFTSRRNSTSKESSVERDKEKEKGKGKTAEEIKQIIELNQFFRNRGYNYSVDTTNVDEIYMNCLFNNEYQKLKLLMEYTNKKNIMIDVNSKSKQNLSPFLILIYQGCYETIKLIVDYSTQNNIKLDVNVKDRNNGLYPLLWSIYRNNLDIVKKLISYSNETGNILEVNDRSKNGFYPLLGAIENNSIECFKLLLDYVKRNNLVLHLFEKDIKPTTKLKKKTLILLKQAETNGLIKIEYNDSNDGHRKSLINQFQKLKLYEENTIIEEENEGESTDTTE